jgi:NAD+ synthase
MTERMQIAIAQLNPTLGAIDANVERMLEIRSEAATAGADLVVYQEMSVAGYPPGDLVLKPIFTDECARGLERLRQASGDGGPAMVVGAPRRVDGNLHNTAYLMAEGEVVAAIDKQVLPNYGVFDEKRVFEKGQVARPVDFKGWQLGLMVCEDFWWPEICGQLKERGAEILIAPHGSVFEIDKLAERYDISCGRTRETGLPAIFVNQVGGQDELVFDGSSFVMNAKSEIVVQLKSFREDWEIVTFHRTAQGSEPDPGRLEAPLETELKIYQALLLGLRDYIEKNHFPGVIIGLSGGIDSALTAALAVDALGPERVHAVMMPSPYTSTTSIEDAEACAKALEITFRVVPITPMMEAFEAGLDPTFEGYEPDTTEENLQARIRGNILMALSNKFGEMVIATGNKSEFSVGYSTLYGDLCGGYAVLKDLYKTRVYELSAWRNQNRPEGALGPEGEVISQNIFTKAPSAELKPGQTDQDVLPPYEELDRMLGLLIEGDATVEEVAAQGFDRETVARIEHMIYIAEYKRRQAPPGVKITSRQFGSDRRYPITNSFQNAKRWRREES